MNFLNALTVLSFSLSTRIPTVETSPWIRSKVNFHVNFLLNFYDLEWEIIRVCE